MGLREWLIKPYLERLNALERRLDKIEGEVKTLDVLMEMVKDNKQEIRELRPMIRELFKEIERLRFEFEAIELKSQGDLSNREALDKEEFVLALIERGVHSPSELSELTGIPKGTLYKILKRLLKVGLIKKKGKGRNTKYVLAEADSEV